MADRKIKESRESGSELRVLGPVRQQQFGTTRRADHHQLLEPSRERGRRSRRAFATFSIHPVAEV
jgi:hypothetical protein